MKRTTFGKLLLCTVFASGLAVAQADDYADAYKAAHSGDYSTAFTKWRSLAEQGDPNAQFNLALIYHGGLSVTADEEEAVRWYHRSAEGGNLMAQEYLAVAYEEGWFGLSPDAQKSQYWYQKLAGNPNTDVAMTQPARLW